MESKFESVYSIVSKDDEIIRFTNYLYNEYLKVITHVFSTDNRVLTYNCIQSLIISHKNLCESYTYISYIETMNTNNIDYLKILNRYIKIREETELIYQDLEKRLAKSICYSDISKSKKILNSYKQILIYQKVIQNYYKEISSNIKLIDKLLYEKLL